MERYYRIRVREKENFMMPMILLYILGFILLWDYGWRMAVFSCSYVIFLLLFNLKIEVRKLRNKK